MQIQQTAPMPVFGKRSSLAMAGGTALGIMLGAFQTYAQGEEGDTFEPRPAGYTLSETSQKIAETGCEGSLPKEELNDVALAERMKRGAVQIEQVVRAGLPYRGQLRGGPIPGGEDAENIGGGGICRLTGNENGTYTALVVTDNHVVSLDSVPTNVVFYNGVTLPGSVVYRLPGQDVALVEVKDIPKEMAPGLVPIVGTPYLSDVAQGDSIRIYSSPFGLEGTYTGGLISATDRFFYKPNLQLPTVGPFLQSDALAEPGTSGGVPSLSSGESIGLVDAIAGMNGDHTLITPFGRVREILYLYDNGLPNDQGLTLGLELVAMKDFQELIQQKQEKQGRLEANPERNERQEEELLNVTAEVEHWHQWMADSYFTVLQNRGEIAGGIVVAGIIDPDGAGVQSGLQPWDIILEINGQSVEKAELEPVVQYLKQQHPSHIPLVVRVLRQGQIQDITVTDKAQLAEQE